MKKGISLVTLIISIVIIIIVATVTIQSGIQRTGEAIRAKHNQNISSIQEELEGYYYLDGNLPVKNLTPYPITLGSALEAEIVKNGEQADNFYVLDMKKLGRVSGDDNSSSSNDTYIVSSTRHNIYYLKGSTIKGATYYGEISKDNNVKLSDVSTPISVGGFDGTLNSPKLAEGMTAVKWNGSSWITADTTNSGNDWYDYTKGINKWANAKLADGSLMVWIPRYTYKILSNEHSGSNGNIDIKFSSGKIDDTSNGYRVHPAFYWGGWNIPASSGMTKVLGGNELTGIWVAKFEASSVNNQQGTSGDIIKNQANSVSWRNIKISDIFDKCRAMQTTNAGLYGISTDSNAIAPHLLKNSEWGAVIYLSKYALGSTQVAINPSTSYVTANGDLVANKNESTTGNEYGIYDMSGGTNEYVALYLNNNNSVLNIYCSSLVAAAAQYKDIFPAANSDGAANNYSITNYAYGHGLYETSASGAGGANGWFWNYTYFAETSAPLIERGGYYADGGVAGLFYFSGDNGTARTSVGFRPAIIVQ